MSVEVTYKSKVLVEDYAALRYPRWSPGGKTLLYTRYGMPWYRPRYRGTAAAQTWSVDLETVKDDESSVRTGNFSMRNTCPTARIFWFPPQTSQPPP